jgi:hypothetical protein
MPLPIKVEPSGATILALKTWNFPVAPGDPLGVGVGETVGVGDGIAVGDGVAAVASGLRLAADEVVGPAWNAKPQPESAKARMLAVAIARALCLDVCGHNLILICAMDALAPSPHIGVRCKRRSDGSVLAATTFAGVILFCPPPAERAGADLNVYKTNDLG